jgi:predicted DNA-binding transcriptional regulator AlpA
MNQMKLLTRKEVSEMLGIKPVTLDKWRKDDGMNFPKIKEYSSKTKGWLLRDIENWQREALKGG